MKLFKLLLIFILMFSLTACARLPISEWMSYIDEKVGYEDQEPRVNGDAGNDIDIDEDEDEAEDGELGQDNDTELDDEIYLEDHENLEQDNIVEDDAEDKDSNSDPYNDQGNDVDNNDGLVLVETFNTSLPENIDIELKYDKYPMSYDYILLLESANIRELPSVDSSIVGKRGAMERISLVAEVRGQYLDDWNKDTWYQVEWEEKDETKSGYIFSGLAEIRQFQFYKMVEAIEELERATSDDVLAHISNYKNKNGIPPKIGGKTSDAYGHRRSQSAAGYEEPNKSAKFRYIPDGTLLQVLDKRDGFSKVRVVGFEGEYWVLDKYINTKNTLAKLNKVIIVDRKYQNQGVFELIDGQWTLVSYGLSTTGRSGTYSLETPLGYYMAIEKRDRFLYFKDGTNQIAGYAPYAIRFSGGGYIHGVPMDYKIEDGKRIDPGMGEYLHSIGTTPRSHMCVRNYTSQAKFLYNWIGIGETALTVIE